MTTPSPEPPGGTVPPAARVLIVGGGPAGLALARQLAGRGAAITLVEASRRADQAFRGQGLMPSGLEALAALGLDPLPAGIPRRPLRGWSFVLDRRPLFTVDEPMGSPRPCTLIEPGALLRHLRSELNRAADVTLLSGRSVVALVERQGRAGGVVLDDGTQLTAELVVACDGRGSTLRRLSELPFDAAASPIDVLWFRLRAPASAPIEAWLADRFVTLVGPGGSGALFRRADGGVQLGWVIDAGAGRGGEGAGAGSADSGAWLRRWAELAPPALARLLAQVPPRAVRGPVRLPVRVGLARRWHRPGLLLLGDAAHPMSPVRAQGLNMALRDARVAASQLAEALTIPEPGQRMEALDQALGRIEALRLAEVRAVQAAQAEEAARGELLRHNHRLRALLAATAPLSGPLLALRWRAGQRILREGLPLPP